MTTKFQPEDQIYSKLSRKGQAIQIILPFPQTIEYV